MEREFWVLVERYRIGLQELSLICNAPIKVLLSWTEKEVPKHLELDV